MSHKATSLYPGSTVFILKFSYKMSCLSSQLSSPQADYVFTLVPSRATCGLSCHSTPVGNICVIRSELLQLAAVVFCCCCVIGRIVTPLVARVTLDVAAILSREHQHRGTSGAHETTEHLCFGVTCPLISLSSG
jgi:hypothetical protein